MEVRYVRHINQDKENRVEFLLVNFDYIDGSEHLARMFCEQYEMQAEDKLDGIWFSIIKLHSKDITYELLWHEDIGNVIYSAKQDEASIAELEMRLKHILEELNRHIISADSHHDK